VGFFLGILLSVAFYLLYNPTNNVPYFWNYGSFHYFWWIMPWLAFTTYLSFRRAPFVLGRRAYFAALLGPLLFILPLGVRDVVVASSADPKALAFTTSYAGQTVTLRVLARQKIDALDLRVFFQQPPSFNGSRAEAVILMHVMLNGVPEVQQWDYMASQCDRRFDFSFLSHDLHLKPGDDLTIQFSHTQDVVIDHLDAVSVAYAPFGAVRHFVQNDL
jgi:hypothetical protein